MPQQTKGFQYLYTFLEKNKNPFKSEVHYVIMAMPADVLHPSNSEEFNKILAEHPTGFIFVDVYTDWCGPCKRFAPVFQEVQAMYKDKAVFVKLNLEEAREIGAEYKISAIPTLLFFKDGKMIQQIVGAPSKGEYVKVIEKIMEN